jgi:hypothetical protein
LTQKKLVDANQSSWQDYFNGLKEGEKWQSRFVQENNLTKVSLDDVKNAQNAAKQSAIAYNNGLKQMTIGAKAASVGMKALSMAGNMIAAWAIGEVISLVVTGIDNLVHASEKAREKSNELTESWNEENSSLDESISKYKELKTKLADSSLSNEEIKTTKEQLTQIQDELNEKYGDEAEKLDLVNGKYDEQLGKLEKISKKKASDYVSTNYNNIKEDKKYLNEELIRSTVLGVTRKIDDSEISKLEKIVSKYKNLGFYRAENGFYGLDTNGTREQILEQLTNLFDDISNSDLKYKASYKSTITDLKNDSDFDQDKINKAKNNVKKYAEAEILSRDDTREMYNEATNAVEKYNKALASGKGVESAKKNLNAVKNKVKDINKTVSGGKAVFDDLFSGIDEGSKKSQDSLDDTVNEYASTKSKHYQKLLKKYEEIESITDFSNIDENIINDFKNNATQKQIKKFEEAQQNLEDEYQKISDWGLDDYADAIKKNKLSQFGNVDMDKRTIIHWSDELKQTYADALASWDYNPEVGSIDTVFGGSDRFGENLDGNGWEVAFTPILPDGTFLSKDTVEKYINTILQKAYADDGKVSDDELKKLDAQGMKIGDTFVHGIYAAISASQDYDNNGNWAEVVGRLMHFSGEDGAIQIAKKDISDTLLKNLRERFVKQSQIDAKRQFANAWSDLDNADDDSGMKNTKKDLTTLAESGKLTRKTFEATEGAKTWLSQIGIDADVAIKKINDLVDSSKQLNSLKSSIKSIQDAYADKRDNGVAGADTLSGMEPEFGKLKSWNEFKNTLGSTTSALTDCQEAQNKLASEYVNSNNFLSQLTEENKDYYTSQLKDLGIKNAQEVVTTQLENKAKSLNLAYSALSKEQKKTVKSGEELAEMSGTDIAMLLGEANGSKKARIELAKLAYQTTNWSDLDATQTIEQLNNIAKAAGIAANNISLLQDVNNNPSKYQGSSLEAAARANGMTVDEYSKKMAKDQVGNKLNKKGKKTKTKIDIDLSLPKVTGSGSGSDSSSSNKVFDWIEVRLKRLEDKVKKTVDKINDYASKKTKNGLFKQAKKQYDDLLHGYEIAAKKYKKKLDSINLSSDLKKKIQSGDYSIQTIKESAKKGKSKKSQKSVLDAIDSYQEYWDKYTSARDNITETKQNKRELIKKQLEDDISDLEDDLDLLQYEADKTQSRIDKNETKGFAATKSDYKEEISNSKKQINKWNQEKKAYQAYLKNNNIAKTSDEYQDIKQKIRDIDKNISDAEKNQLEWNKSISELPYQNLEKFKNVLDAISSRYEKIISFWESQGHTKNESQITKQISIGLNGLSQLKKERDEKWSQINKTLSDKGLNSSQKKQFKALYEGMREGTITVDQFYKSISKLGISKKTFDSWDGLRDKLQEVDGLDGDILDKQAEIENNYDDLLTPWINSIQDLIDKINDLNDAQSKAIELEKLQQALQSAKQNKKNLIYHEDYGFNYEADNSAVKEAQDNLDDYYNQEQLDTLNKILDWLNDHKDDVNFFDENGKPLYKTVDEAVRAVTKGMTEGMSDSVKKMFNSLTFSIDKNGKITASVPKYATGTKYAKGGMSIVGDGGAELRLLNSGDQILPHDITDNLWKFGVNPTKMILDNIQIPDMSNLVKNTGDKMVNNNVSIGTVTLPNINDLSKANDVFNALAGLSSYAHQQANKR